MRHVIVTVAILAAASAPAAGQDRTTTDTRTGTTSPTRATLPAPPPPTMIIPGGGNLASTPLAIKLASIACITQNESGGDEIYAVVATFALNWEKPWLSKVAVTSTPVLPFMLRGHERETNLAVWGLEGSPLPLADSKSALVLVGVYERGTGNVLMARQLLHARLLERINTLHPGDSYDQITGWMSGIMSKAMHDAVAVVANGGDMHMGGIRRVSLSDPDIAAARLGNPVTKTLEFYDQGGTGIMGKYVVSFRLSK